MDTHRPDEPSRTVLPIYQGVLDDLDAETRETVLAALGTQQDSRRPDPEPPNTHRTDRR